MSGSMHSFQAWHALEACAPQHCHACARPAVRYVKQAKEGEDLRVYAYELPEGVDRASNLEYELHDVTVTDVRSAPQPFTLQENGFKLERLEVPKDVDWDNEEEVGNHSQGPAVHHLSLCSVKPG